MNKVQKTNLWANAIKITNLKDCLFYHTMDIPGLGIVKGQWDLRQGIHNYLGNVDFKRKRVLDIGTASGFGCFYMEKQGADVVAYDISDKQTWDIIPYAGYDYKQKIIDKKNEIQKVNNSFWMAHNAYKSKAKMVYGTVYDIPEGLGVFDITTLGSILLHLRDPFLALQNASKHTRDILIITEPFFAPATAPPFGNLFQTVFLPNSKTRWPEDGWWALSPQIIKKFISILGFEKTKTNFHLQNYMGRKKPLFTIVGYRTKKAAI